MTTRARLPAAFSRCSGLAFGLALAFAAPADASPRSYDVENLLKEGLPAWREGRLPPQPRQETAPMKRLPEAPTLRPASDLQPAPALTPPPPAGRSQDAPRSRPSGAWGG